jgi:hypothetical protein
METPVFEEFDPASDCDCPGCTHWRLVLPHSPTGRIRRPPRGAPAGPRRGRRRVHGLGAGHAVPAVAAARTPRGCPASPQVTRVTNPTPRRAARPRCTAPAAFRPVRSRRPDDPRGDHQPGQDLGRRGGAVQHERVLVRRLPPGLLGLRLDGLEPRRERMDRAASTSTASGFPGTSWSPATFSCSTIRRTPRRARTSSFSAAGRTTRTPITSPTRRPPARPQAGHSVRLLEPLGPLSAVPLQGADGGTEG